MSADVQRIWNQPDGLNFDLLPSKLASLPTKTLNFNVPPVPVLEETLEKEIENADIDWDLYAIRKMFTRKELPSAYGLPLTWKTQGQKHKPKRIHPLEPNGGDVEVDPRILADDTNVWDVLLQDHEPERDDSLLTDTKVRFPSNQSNPFGTLTLEDKLGDDLYENSLPQGDPDPPKMPIPGIEGIFIPAKVDDIPICPVWKSIRTEKMTRDIFIKKMDMSLIRPDYTCMVYGKRRSGKTNFIRFFMRNFRAFYPEVYVFTETKVDMEYQPYVPEQYIFEGYNEEVVQALIDRQKRRQAALRRKGVNDENIYILIILDDCITSDTLKYSETARRIFFNGRHLYIGICINSQHHKAIGPNIRSNTDMVAVFPVRSDLDKETVRKNYADFARNEEEFELMTSEISKNAYTILFIDQSRPYMLPEQCVYAGIAPAPDENGLFFMGSREFWRDSENQLIEYGGEEWMKVDDWGIVKETYNFSLNGLPRGLTRPDPLPSSYK